MRQLRLTGQEWALVLLTAVPIGVLILFVARYGYTVPWLDEYVNMVPLVLKQQATTLTLGDLFVQYSDHRLPIPYAISVLFAALSGGDMRWELTFTLMLMLVSFSLLVDLYRRTGNSRTEMLIFTAIAAFLLFSLGQRQNYIWGNQKCIMLMVFGAYLSAWAQGRFPTQRRVWIVCIAGTLIASWSFLGGNVLWGVIPIALWLSGRKKWTSYAAWVLLTGISVALYLNGHTRDANYAAAESMFAPVQSLLYVLAFLGNPLSAESIHIFQNYNGASPLANLLPPLLFGAAGMFALGINLAYAHVVRRVTLRDLSPWLTLTGFSLANGLLLGFGRSDLILALTAHYGTVAVPFWLTVAALTLSNSRHAFATHQGVWRMLVVANGVLMLTFVIGYSANTQRAWVLRESYNRLVETCFVTHLAGDPRCMEDFVFARTWVQPEEVRAQLSDLQAHRLFLFR